MDREPKFSGDLTSEHWHRTSDSEARIADLEAKKGEKREKMDELLDALANNQYVLRLVQENPQLLVEGEGVDVEQIAKENASILQELLSLAADISYDGAELLRTHLHQDQLRKDLLRRLRQPREEVPSDTQTPVVSVEDEDAQL